MPDADLATAGSKARHRTAADHFTTGLAVVTSSDARGAVAGRVVSSITSLSLEPPTVLLAVPTGSELQHAIDESGGLGISLLRDDQALVADRFSDGLDATSALIGLGTKPGQHGQPILTDCLAWMDGTVTESLSWDGDRVYVCRVLDASTSPGRPLVRYRGVSGRYQAFQEATDYASFRRMVLDRVGSADDLLTIDEVAGSLGMDESSAQEALTRLQEEGLVRVNPDDGSHLVLAIDENGASEALEARLLMEMAATEILRDKLTTGQVAEFDRRRVECQKSTRATSGGVHHDAHLRFHEYAVALTGNSLLVDAYRNFNVPNETWDAITDETRDGIDDDHAELVHFYRTGDLPAARDLLRRHRERTEQATNPQESVPHVRPARTEKK